MLHIGHGECVVHKSTTLISNLSPYRVAKPSRNAVALALCPPPVSLIRHITRFCSPWAVISDKSSLSLDSFRKESLEKPSGPDEVTGE